MAASTTRSGTFGHWCSKRVMMIFGAFLPWVSCSWELWGHVILNNLCFAGGETRPELQKEIFSPSYAAGTYERQDFIRAVYTTVSA